MPSRPLVTASFVLLLLAGAALGREAPLAISPGRPAVTAPGASARGDLLAEGFEGAFPPAGWTVLHLGEDNGWDRTSAASHGGGFSAWVHYGSPGHPMDEWLVSPPLDLSALFDPRLEFFEDEVDWEDYGRRHAIMVSTTVPDDPGAFTALVDWTPADHAINGFDGDPVSLSLAAWAGQGSVRVAFRYIGEWADDWYIDDVRIHEQRGHDLMAVAVLPDGEQFSGGAVIVPHGIVANAGLHSEGPFDVLLQISSHELPLYEDRITVPVLAAGDQIELFFAPHALADGNYFELALTSLLEGDEDAGNDRAVGLIDTYNLPHVPLGILFTNSGCEPCAPVNQALDAFMAAAGDSVALLRVHAYWPNPNDVMWLAGQEQAGPLISAYGVLSVPHFFVDGIMDLGHAAPPILTGFNDARARKSPLSIEMLWRPIEEQLVVTLSILNPLPAGEYFLHACFTEDGIEHDGGNGETLHQQVFRRMLPDPGGVPVPPVMGGFEFAIDSPLAELESEYWEMDPSRLRASVYVQKGAAPAGKVLQAASAFLREIGLTQAGTPGSPAIRLDANYPNPFNPRTTIRYFLDARGPATLSIHDVQGRRLRTLFAGEQEGGEHEAVWDGRDEAGSSLASGIYFARLQAGGRVLNRKVVQAK